MLETFERFMTKEVGLTAAEISRASSLGTVRTLKRRELLLKEGEICLYKGFVLKGLLKTGAVRDNGLEYIMRFNPENSWAVDPMSFTKKIPARYSIEAVEPSTMLLWSAPAFHELNSSIPALRTYMSKLLLTTLDDSHDRIRTNISFTSEEKYQDFVNTFPDLLARLPLHLVAAYLGISRETLSRVRHVLVKRG